MPETRIYIDTNVYMDMFEDRHDNLRPLGELAFQLFERMFNCEFRVIFSTEVMDELRFCGCESQIQELLLQMKSFNKVEFIESNREDKCLASKNKDTSHFKDRLHYVLAEKAKAELFITRNWKDFMGLGDIPVLLPEYA